MATQFILQARSGIKIANLLKYSSGTLLLECDDVAAASNVSWAFFSHFRAKMGTSSQGLSKKKPPMETRRVCTKMETSKTLGYFCLVTSQDSCYQHILVLSTD